MTDRASASRADSPATQSAADEALEAARAAKLRYVSDAIPGIRRRRAGRGFAYSDPEGRRVTSSSELARIRHLAVPPAWRDVWISPFANGHVQAIGRDARGRKQYVYHERWREVRDQDKYERLVEFAETLPLIRRCVDRDLRRPGLPLEKVVATVVRLLDTSFLRIGNEAYARDNHSYGLTTLRDEHVDVDGATLRFRFRGKSGREHSVELTDRRVARVIRECQDLPGQELFQYLDDAQARHAVRSEDVNEWLREASGADFTAKDFRTWAGTVLAATALRSCGECETARAARRDIAQAVREVSSRLGNTPAVCRRCYIHPEVPNAHLEGGLVRALGDLQDVSQSKDVGELRAEEAWVVALLRKRLKETTQPLARRS